MGNTIQKNQFEEFFKTKDPKLREQIILDHLSLVHKIKNKFLGKGLPPDTLYSVGCIGLIQAVDRFDPNQGAQFSTYAYAIISGEIKHHFRDKAWAVSVPRGLKEDYQKINKTIQTLSQKLKTSPNTTQIAKELQITEERVLEALEAGREYTSLSLDAPAQNSTETTSSLGEQISENRNQQDEFMNSFDLKEVLHQLPKREQLVITMSYLHDLSQQQISERLGVSQNHVSRLMKQALEKLQNLA